MKKIMFIVMLFGNLFMWGQDCSGVTPDKSIISDFECQENYHLGPDGTDAAPKIDNPHKTGINTSDHVGEYTDNGTDAWDNLIIDFKKVIDLSSKSQFKIKIYSTKPGPLLVKLEGGTAVEKKSAIGRVNEWVEYTFDFSKAAGKGNKKLIIFFNAGKTDGTNSDKYYIDDLRFTEWKKGCTAAADNSIISDFECQQNYEKFETSGSELIAITNFDKTGDNSSALVGEFVDNGTVAWYFLKFKTGGVIDLSEKNQLNIKVYSTKKVPLLAKLEGGTAVEKSANITETGIWKNYVFDFSDAAGKGNKDVVFFFNAGKTDGTDTDVYYVDDIKFTKKTSSVGKIGLNDKNLILAEKEGIFELSAQNDMNMTDISVYDITGRMIYHSNKIDRENYKVNLTGVSTGNLLLFRVSLDNGSVVVKKVIKH